MAKTKRIIDAEAWFCDGLPPETEYSRDSAETKCREAMGRHSTKHRILFSKLQWSELKPGDAGVPSPPTGAPTGIKLLRVEGTEAGPQKRRRPPKPSFGKSDRFKAFPHDFVFLHEPALPVTDKQVQKIAASLDVGEDSEHVAAVLAAIRRFHGREIAMSELPSGDHRTRDIETLEALARGMEGLNPNVLAALARHGVELGDCEPAHIAGVARLAAKDTDRRRPPSKTGARPKTSRKLVLRDLAAIYTDATGQPGKISKTSETKKTVGGRPTGPFFRFIRAAVSPVPTLKIILDHALASAVTWATTSK